MRIKKNSSSSKQAIGGRVMEREREAGQLFLQCMMQRAALSKREAIKTYATCVGKTVHLYNLIKVGMHVYTRG